MGEALLDVKGLICPLPILKARKALKRVPVGATLRVLATDPGADEDFAAFCDAHPDRTVVVYANTSAAVKARADWMVTSSCALAVVNHLKAQGQNILWAPDRHLGRYIQEQTGADMLLWNGACIVHDEFKGLELELLKKDHPHAMILVHPESPRSVVQMALAEAKAKARAEFEGVLAETGKSLEELRDYVNEHPHLKQALYHFPHRKGLAGTAAQFAWHVSDLMNKDGAYRRHSRTAKAVQQVA